MRICVRVWMMPVEAKSSVCAVVPVFDNARIQTQRQHVNTTQRMKPKGRSKSTHSEIGDNPCSLVLEFGHVGGAHKEHQALCQHVDSKNRINS